jgi:hypothetical protein
VNNDLLFNSIRVLKQNWELVLAIVTGVAWGTLVVFAILKKIVGQHYSDVELTALALGGWPLPILLMSLLIIFLNVFVSFSPIIIVSLILIICSAGLALRSIWNKTSLHFTPLIFVALVFVRLGFVANIILPAYFDSAEHYRIIQSLLSMNTVFPTTTYYHIGYHIIVAAFTLVTHQNIGQVMLIFGQVVLAAIPLPIYFLTLYLTGSRRAGFFSVVLAAFGWYMPAHAVNWGKYPALLSLLMIQFTLGAALIKKPRLFILSLIVSALIHSRSIILIVIIFGAWVLSAIWSRQTRNKRALVFGIACAVLGVSILWFKQQQILGTVLEPYWIWVTLLVGFLSVFAFQSFGKLQLFSILTIFFMLVGMFVPITPAIALLDRPLVEMILFLPLAILGGLGTAQAPRSITVLIAVYIVVQAWMTYSFLPSDCCQLVSRDDAVALDWMDKNLPRDARIAIASTDLILDNFSRPMQNTGTDAGIWVTPLTKRVAVPLSYTTDFIDQRTHTLLCDMHITYVYFGARLQSFNSVSITTKPEWYEIVLFFPNVKIAGVHNC